MAEAKPKRAAAPKRAEGAKRAKKPRKGLAKRIATWVGIIVLALSLIGVGTVVAFYNSVDLPEPNEDFTTSTTFLYYRDGTTKLGDLSVQNRVPLTYEQIPQVMKDAATAAEDRTFWTNRGISVRGLVRSAWNILRGGDIASGSTITQQYIKVMYLTSERTMTRKFRELALAVKLSRTQSKEQILTDYLNTIYFGRGAYGVQSAAQAYFGVDAGALTIPQAASLAAILNSPAYLDPSDPDNVTRFTERYNYVIDGMLDMGTITQAQHDEFRGNPPEFPTLQTSQRYAGPKGFLIKMVEAELAANGFTSDQINGGGLQVTTTFDATMQDAIISAAQNMVTQANANPRRAVAPNALKVGMASIEVGTGAVLAVYGGPDYVNDSRNWATTARPAGSSFKPYALVAGLRQGFSLRSIVRGSAWTPPGDRTPLRNAGGINYGNITLLKATEDSVNTAYVDMTVRLPGGPQSVVTAANDAGVPTGAGWDLNNRISLGSAEVTPVDQAGAYATFANRGRRAANHVIAQVRDSAGTVLYSAGTDTTPTIDQDVADDVNYALQGVVNDGTGYRIQGLGREVAAKTGTNMVESGAITSFWLVGYTKQISTSVMIVAGDAGTNDVTDYDSGSRSGSYWTALAWNDYMKVATQGQPVVDFDAPAYVNGNGREASQLPRATQAPATTAAPTETPSETATEEPAPTTEAPAPEPTTQAPAPTTEAPAPTTVAPTTAAPTSAAPTAPSTQGPQSTRVPSSGRT